MADTIIDPPPPPTIREEPPPPPKPRSRRVLWIAVAAASILTLAALGALAYVLFVGHEPVARRHIPGNANLIARFDATDIIVFGPVRKHLWPILFEQAFSSSSPPANAKAAPSRAERLKQVTGINFATDTREAILASVDATSWVLLVGGDFPKGRFVKGLETIAREDAWVGWRREGPLFVGPGGVALGQADDGTITVGTDTQVVTASLPATDEWTRMGLPEKGAVTFALTADAWSGMQTSLGPAVPGSSAFGRIARSSGSFTLGSTPELSVRFEPASGADATSLAAEIERALGSLRILLLLLPDMAGEKGAVAAASVRAAEGAVTLQTRWPYEGLDRACEAIARRIREAMGEPVSSAPAAPAPTMPTIPGLPGALGSAMPLPSLPFFAPSGKSR